MATDHVPESAARALRTYDAIAHDLAIRSSPALQHRLEALEADILALTRTATIAQARAHIAKPAPTPKPDPPREQQRKQRSQGKPKRKRPRDPQPKPTKDERRNHPHAGHYEIRGQDHSRKRATSRTVDARKHPAQVTGVVSGGLPGTGRRH